MGMGMNAIPLLALSFALGNPVAPAPLVVTAAEIPAAHGDATVETVHVEAAPVEAAPVETGRPLSMRSVVLAAGAGGVGVALGVPLIFGLAALAPPNFFIGEPLLLLPFALVLPAPLLAGGAAAIDAHLDDLAPAHATGRVSFSAAGAGGVALLGTAVGGYIGLAQPCSGWFCGLGNAMLGGLGGALVGGAVGSAGGLLLGDALFSGSRAPEE